MSSEPFAVWFTGVPASGKTTLATALIEALPTIRTLPIDGDWLRKVLPLEGDPFSKESRDKNVLSAAVLALHSMLNEDACPIISLISPYEDSRRLACVMLGSRVLVVHVKANLEVLVRRDPKGLYKLAMAGKIKNFTGLDDPYEPPTEFENPLVIDTAEQSVETATVLITKELERRGFIGPGRAYFPNEPPTRKE